MIQKLFKKTKLTYDGEYRGIVVDIMDPLELGRVRVRVWGISEDTAIPVASLPWAKPKPSMINGSIGKFGSFWVPDLNSKVTIEFENGNPLSPAYKSEAPDGIDGIPAFVTKNYPYRQGIALSNGFIFWIDKSTNEIQLTHPSGTIIDIDTSGNLSETIVGNLSDAVSKIASIIDETGQKLCQSGMIIAYAGNTAPSGWLLCYGQSYTTSKYPLLFSAIGYTYGGSGATFNVPDYRGKIPVGLDNMGGVDAQILLQSQNIMTGSRNTLGGIIGEPAHTQTEDELVPHDHEFAELSNPGSSGPARFYAQGTGQFTDDAGGGLPFNVVQPGLMSNIIIKI